MVIQAIRTEKRLRKVREFPAIDLIDISLVLHQSSMIVCVDIWCEPTIIDIKFNDYKRNPLIASTVFPPIVSEKWRV